MNGNVDEGLALLRSAAAKNPLDFSIRLQLVEACARAARWDQAVREFCDLTRATPNFPQVHFDTLARAVAVGATANLSHAFEQATVVASSEPAYWYGLGLLRQLGNDQQGAADAFRRGLRADRDDALLQYNLGVALMDDPATAEIWLQAATRNNPNMAEPHYALATLNLDRDLQRAAGHYRRFIELAPPHLQEFSDNAKAALNMLQAAG